jgi:hypothetical protein
VLVSRENAALKRRSSTVVRAASVRGKRAGSGSSTRAQSLRFLALRLALGRYASSRVAQDDKQIGYAAAIRRLNKAHGSNPMVFV